MKQFFLKSLVISTGIFFFSCQPQTPITDATGDIKAMIPIAGTNENSLSVVTIKNMTSLKEVSGSYAKFYYTPGSKADGLTGGAPTAQFIRTKDSVYVPSDSISQQMFVLYYHIQNLNDFNEKISSELKQKTPFQIGLNTQVGGDSINKNNNAFFDGESNSLLFVPYSLNNLPISINSGIIAHEFFHSIFYGHMLKNFNLQQEALVKNAADTDAAQKNYFFNQTYIRGLNEGLADYWGWVYTNNTDYISMSLPKYGADRKMELNKDTLGKIETDTDISNKVEEAQTYSTKPTDYLSGYIYKIGTPHARFLKELTQKISFDNHIDITAAKLLVTKSIYNYLKNLSTTTSTYKIDTQAGADDFFKYFAQPKISGLNLTDLQCDFVLLYVQDPKTIKTDKCVGSVK